MPVPANGANGFRLGLPGLQAGLTLDLGWPGPSRPLLDGSPSGSGDRLQPGQSNSNSVRVLGNPGFSFSFGGGDSSGPSADEAAWPWPGAKAAAAVLGGGFDGGLDGGLPPGDEADVVRVAQGMAPAPDAVGAVGVSLIGDPSEVFSAWSGVAGVDAPLVGDLARGVASGASSLLGGGLFGTPAPEEGIVFNLFTR